MEFVTHAHRDADSTIHAKASAIWGELTGVLTSLDEVEVAQRHSERFNQKMSLSHSINDLLKERLIALGWKHESRIFQDKAYDSKAWRLDFTKDPIAVEVAFNHGEAVAWNLLKPVLSSELNHVSKAVQTKIGVVVTVTKAMKKAGAFDGAVGEYEKFIRYLKPLGMLLPTPTMLIGIQPPKTYWVEKVKIAPRKNIGVIRQL